MTKEVFGNGLIINKKAREGISQKAYLGFSPGGWSYSRGISYLRSWPESFLLPPIFDYSLHRQGALWPCAKLGTLLHPLILNETKAYHRISVWKKLSQPPHFPHEGTTLLRGEGSASIPWRDFLLSVLTARLISQSLLRNSSA